MFSVCQIALATLLRITNPTPEPHLYTAAQLSLAMPYTSSDFRSSLPYSVSDWESDLERRNACQCLTLKVSPDGKMVMGQARACSCDE